MQSLRTERHEVASRDTGKKKPIRDDRLFCWPDDRLFRH
jgi:hypothetical protein